MVPAQLHNTQLNLVSTNRRADLILILVVLTVESCVQLGLATSSILDLDATQLLLGIPVTLVITLAGTVLPTMVFIHCILVPRYLKLTRSVPATVILGGLTYAGLHIFDGWTAYGSASDTAISVLYVALFYTAPGMFKTFLTLRTGNAWTHALAYHAFTPHTFIDTPLIVDAFDIN